MSKPPKDVNKDNIPKKTIIVSYAVINITSLLCILANQFQSREVTTLSWVLSVVIFYHAYTSKTTFFYFCFFKYNIQKQLDNEQQSIPPQTSFPLTYKKPQRITPLRGFALLNLRHLYPSAQIRFLIFFANSCNSSESAVAPLLKLIPTSSPA